MGSEPRHRAILTRKGPSWERGQVLDSSVPQRGPQRTEWAPWDPAAAFKQVWVTDSYSRWATPFRLLTLSVFHPRWCAYCEWSSSELGKPSHPFDCSQRLSPSILLSSFSPLPEPLNGEGLRRQRPSTPRRILPWRKEEMVSPVPFWSSVFYRSLLILESYAWWLWEVETPPSSLPIRATGPIPAPLLPTTMSPRGGALSIP